MNASLVGLASLAITTMQQAMQEQMGHVERLHEDLISSRVDEATYRATLDTAAAIGDTKDPDEDDDGVTTKFGDLLERVMGAFGKTDIGVEDVVDAFKKMSPEEQADAGLRFAAAMEESLPDEPGASPEA